MMSPSQENGEENGTPDINEMARRWRQGAPTEASDDRRTSEYPTTSGEVVSYHGGGYFYIPQELRKKLNVQGWDLPTYYPIEYDAEANELTIHLNPVDGDAR